MYWSNIITTISKEFEIPKVYLKDYSLTFILAPGLPKAGPNAPPLLGEFVALPPTKIVDSNVAVIDLRIKKELDFSDLAYRRITNLLRHLQKRLYF
jgi:hypothetical protein